MILVSRFRGNDGNEGGDDGKFLVMPDLIGHPGIGARASESKGSGFPFARE